MSYKELQGRKILQSTPVDLTTSERSSEESNPLSHKSAELKLIQPMNDLNESISWSVPQVHCFHWYPPEENSGVGWSCMKKFTSQIILEFLQFVFITMISRERSLRKICGRNSENYRSSISLIFLPWTFCPMLLWMPFH